MLVGSSCCQRGGPPPPGGGGEGGGEGGGGGGGEEGGVGGEGGGRKRGGQTPQPLAPLDPLSRARTKNSHRIVLRQQSMIYTSHVTDQRGIYKTHHNIRLLSPWGVFVRMKL